MRFAAFAPLAALALQLGTGLAAPYQGSDALSARDASASVHVVSRDAYVSENFEHGSFHLAKRDLLNFNLILELAQLLGIDLSANILKRDVNIQSRDLLTFQLLVELAQLISAYANINILKRDASDSYVDVAALAQLLEILSSSTDLEVTKRDPAVKDLISNLVTRDAISAEIVVALGDLLGYSFGASFNPLDQYNLLNLNGSFYLNDLVTNSSIDVSGVVSLGSILGIFDEAIDDIDEFFSEVSSAFDAATSIAGEIITGLPDLATSIIGDATSDLGALATLLPAIVSSELSALNSGYSSFTSQVSAFVASELSYLSSGIASIYTDDINFLSSEVNQVTAAIGSIISNGVEDIISDIASLTSILGNLPSLTLPSISLPTLATVADANVLRTVLSTETQIVTILETKTVPATVVTATVTATAAAANNANLIKQLYSLLDETLNLNAREDSSIVSNMINTISSIIHQLQVDDVHSNVVQDNQAGEERARHRGRGKHDMGKPVVFTTEITQIAHPASPRLLIHNSPHKYSFIRNMHSNLIHHVHSFNGLVTSMLSTLRSTLNVIPRLAPSSKLSTQKSSPLLHSASHASSKTNGSNSESIELDAEQQPILLYHDIVGTNDETAHNSFGPLIPVLKMNHYPNHYHGHHPRMPHNSFDPKVTQTTVDYSPTPLAAFTSFPTAQRTLFARETTHTTSSHTTTFVSLNSAQLRRVIKASSRSSAKVSRLLEIASQRNNTELRNMILSRIGSTYVDDCELSTTAPY